MPDSHRISEHTDLHRTGAAALTANASSPGWGYYPTASRLEQTAMLIGRWVQHLHVTYRTQRMAVAARSMGGPVTRGSVNRAIAANDGRAEALRLHPDLDAVGCSTSSAARRQSGAGRVAVVLRLGSGEPLSPIAARIGALSRAWRFFGGDAASGPGLAPNPQPVAIDGRPCRAGAAVTFARLAHCTCAGFMRANRTRSPSAR
jgi:hypothetical protein